MFLFMQSLLYFIQKQKQNFLNVLNVIFINIPKPLTKLFYL